MIATGERLESEYRLLRRDGSVAWVRDEGVLVRDEAGEPLCMQGYILDITERKEREAALRQSEARMRAMLDAALDAVVTIDTSGAIIEFNPAAERIFGYARDAVVGRQMVDLLVPPALRAAHVAGFSTTWRRARAGPRASASRSGGARRRQRVPDRAEHRGSTCRASRSSPPMCATSASRSAREAALLESEAIVDSSFDAIVGRTPDGIVTSWNAAAERIFGYSAEEMIGRSVAHPRAARRAACSRRSNERLRRGEVVEPIEAVCVRKDGTRIDVESTVSPIVGAAGRRHRRLVDLARHQRAQALAGARRGPGASCSSSSPAATPLPERARPRRALRRGARRRRARLDPAARPRRRAPARTARRRACPTAYCEAIDGVAIGPSVGSCGTAAYRRERVCVSDIASDPLWDDFRELALARRACAPAGRRRSSRPTTRCSARSRSTTASRATAARDDLELVELATHVAGIAIERARSEEARARERGALPRPLRERERADRDRHDGRARSPRSTAPSSACSATRATS